MKVCIVFHLLFVVAPLLSSSLFGQSETADLSSRYASEMKKLPKRLSITTSFKSVLSREQLVARYERLSTERLKALRGLPPKEIEAMCQGLGIPRGKLDEYVSKSMKDGLQVRLQNLELQGKHSFYVGDFLEIRSFTLDGVPQKTLQYGIYQPALEAEDPNRWVVQLCEKKGGRTVLLSESKVSLNGMLPIGVHHPAIQQKYSSTFSEFFAEAGKLTFGGKVDNENVYVVKHAEPILGLKDSWLVASIENPTQSVVPKWIARINAPGKASLDRSDLGYVVVASNAVQLGKNGQLPNGVFIHSIVSFRNPKGVGDFAEFPTLSEYTTCMDWPSATLGFTEASPFESFQLRVLDTIVDPPLPPKISVKDGDSFYDYDTKRGWIIGRELAPIVQRKSGVIRWVLWISAGLALLLVIYLKTRK